MSDISKYVKEGKREMREILFRGKTPSQYEHFDDGEWEQGFYVCLNGKEHRIYNGYAETDCVDYYPDWCNVRPDTVGRFTGLTDKNGTNIFEGDIHERENHFFVVKYGKYRDCETSEDGYGWYFEYTHRKGCEGFDGTESEYVNIIGNIHDNPELLRTHQNDEVRK